MPNSFPKWLFQFIPSPVANACSRHCTSSTTPTRLIRLLKMGLSNDKNTLFVVGLHGYSGYSVVLNVDVNTGEGKWLSWISNSYAFKKPPVQIGDYLYVPGPRRLCTVEMYRPVCWLCTVEYRDSSNNNKKTGAISKFDIVTGEHMADFIYECTIGQIHHSHKHRLVYPP